MNLRIYKTTAVALTKAHFDEAAVNANLENAAKETAVATLSRLNKGKRKEGESSKQLPTNKNRYSRTRFRHFCEGKDIVDNLLDIVSFEKSNLCVGWTI
ncbi:hypothetical protein PS6_009059 [Mucor atramentarius]